MCFCCSVGVYFDLYEVWSLSITMGRAFCVWASVVGGLTIIRRCCMCL